MSQHVFVQKEKKYVFGWDQPLMTFYLQVHDLTRPEDDNPVVWLGAGPTTEMYEVEDLVKAAHQHGLNIDHEMRVRLYAEKDGEVDDGR